MNGPIISLDVSKGESHAHGYLSYGEQYGKTFVIKHDTEGFGKLEELRKSIRGITGKDPVFVLESTGVYSKTVVSYLLSKDCQVNIISPLESAKMRKAEVRPTKNDTLDTITIAKVYYSKPEARITSEDPDTDLRQMSRNYSYRIRLLTNKKNRYHAYLDDIWPGFDEVLDYDGLASLTIVSHYGHPKKIRSKDAVLEVLKKRKMGPKSKDDIAEKTYEYSKSHVSGCKKDAFAVEVIMKFAKEIIEEKKALKKLLERMAKEASSMPEHGIVASIPCITDGTAARIIAELGSIEKFATAKSLVAYVGIDPAVQQSGKVTGEHLNITKKGNRELRMILYTAVKNMVIRKSDCKIAEYVLRKKKDGLSYKVALIAGVNKLIRVIYSMLTNGTCYSES